ncbi:hypothetical protein DFH09DRAFT_1074079 [Mycena vulgaris]|nr:hypothetical protein DFH09DRAFT_1074079 [Mycena vulgaris]
MGNYDFIAICLSKKRGTKESAPGEILHVCIHPSHVTACSSLPGEPHQKCVIECLVRRAQETPDIEEDKEEAKKEYQKKLVDSLSMKPLHKARTAAWEAYIKCFNDTAKGYQSGTPQTNKLLKLANGSQPPPQGESIPVEFKQGWNTRKATPFKFKKKNDENQKLILGLLTGTSDDSRVAPANSDLESVRIWAFNIQMIKTGIVSFTNGTQQRNSTQENLMFKDYGLAPEFGNRRHPERELLTLMMQWME